MKSQAVGQTFYYLVHEGKLVGYFWRSPLDPDAWETSESERGRD